MHVQNTGGHTFDFDGVQIMDRANNKYVRKRLEGIYIYIYFKKNLIH